MHFRKHINEESLVKVEARLLTNGEKKIIIRFQALLSYIVKYFKVKNPNQNDWEEFVRGVQPYLKDPWASPINKMIKRVNEKIKIVTVDKKEAPRSYLELPGVLEKTKKAFFSKDIDTAFLYAKQLGQINLKIKNDKVEITSIIPTSKRNPYLVTPMIIFQTNDFLKSFDISDMEDIVYKDLSLYSYTYLNFPESLLKDFQHLAYFVQKLQKTGKDIQIGVFDMKRFIDYLYQDDGFDKLKKLITSYLHSNDKKLIPEILDTIKKYPKLLKAQEKLKKDTVKVYRGIGGRYPAPAFREIQKMEKQNRIVSTSTRKHAAKNFALQKGHLESERRSEWVYMLVYKISHPLSVIFDTRIFGSVYGEEEILIDTKYAELVDIFEIDEE